MIRRILTPALLLAACGVDADEVELETRTFLLRTLSFAMIEDGVSAGFDLDGVVSDEWDPAGCGKADYEDPSGVQGIDNSLGTILPAVLQAGGQAVPELVQGMVDSGELLLLVEIVDPADTDEDGCVEARLFRGKGTPSIGVDGRILPGQTFDENPVTPPSVDTCASWDGTTLVHANVQMQLPTVIFDEFLDVPFEHGKFELTLMDDGTVQGVLGAGMPIDRVREEVAEMDGIGSTLPLVLDSALATAADLSLDGQTCSHLSVAVEFEGVSAYTFAD